MKLVGILNITPDSFRDGGVYITKQSALKQATNLFSQGATYIDVGAEATNPFVSAIDPEEEIARLAPVLPELLKTFIGSVSIDTYHPETVAWALKYGKPILNDVSGLYKKAMQKIAAKRGLTVVVGHLPKEAKGIPIAAHNVKPVDSATQVRDELLERALALEKFGIKKADIVLDPNIGFGKTMRLNWELLSFAKLVPDYQVMIGHSHKRFLGFDRKGLEVPNGQTLRYTKERNVEAADRVMRASTEYLRVHEPSWYKISAL